MGIQRASEILQTTGAMTGPSPSNTGDRTFLNSDGKVDFRPDISKWVAFNLNQSSFYQDYLSGIETAGEYVKKAFNSFIKLLDIVKAIFEAMKALVVLTQDTFYLLSVALRELLIQFKKALMDFLNDIMNLGFYVYPQFMNYDWVGAISRELLVPYGISVTEGQQIVRNQAKLISVPDPIFPGQTKFQYEAATVNGYGIERFVEDIKIALNNRNDLMRPDFSRAMELSGIVLAVGIDDIFSLLRLVIELIDFMSGKKYALQFAEWIAKQIAPILATSEQRNIGDPKSIRFARAFLSDVKTRKLDSIFSFDEQIDKEQDGISFAFDASKYGGNTSSGNFCSFYLDSSLSDIVLLNTSANYVLGSLRDNRFQYNIDLYAKNADVGIYVQKYHGGSPVYKNGEKFERGIRVMTVPQGTYNDGSFTLPLENVSKSVPSDFAESGWKGVLPGPPAAPSEGDFYMHSGTDNIIQYKSGVWETVIVPNVFEFRLYNESSNEIIGDPVRLYVPRFYYGNEVITSTYTRYDTNKKKVVTDTQNAQYNYGDNYAISGKATFTYSRELLNEAAKVYSIPARNIEEHLNLPFSGTTMDIRSIDFLSGESVNSDIRLKIGFLGNIDDNSEVDISINNKTAKISLESFGISKNYKEDPNDRLDFYIVDYSDKSLIVDINFDMSDGLNVIEVTSGTQKIIVPSGVESGTYSTFEYYAFSKPKTIDIKRNRSGQISDIVVLSSNEIKAGKSNDVVDFAVLKSNLAESLIKTPATTLTGGVFGVGDSEKGIKEAKAKYYFRGTKSNGSGVLIVDSDKKAVHVTLPDSTTFWLDQQDSPQLLTAGTYNYNVYAIDNNFVTFVNETVREDIKFLEKCSKIFNNTANLKAASRFLTKRIRHNVTVTVDENADYDIQNSNWYVFNFKQWLDFIGPLDNLLSALIDSVPVVSVDLDIVKKVINSVNLVLTYWQKWAKKIRDIILKILKFFDFGKTGMYALGIRAAAGTEGYTYRIENSEVISDLAKVPYVTGMVLVAPKYFGGDLLMQTVFSFLPQEPLPNEPSIIGRLDSVIEFADSIQEQIVSSAEKWSTDSWNSIEDKVGRLEKEFE